MLGTTGIKYPVSSIQKKMNGNNPLHKKIKNKLNEHEFEFDPNAWVGIETMLDNQVKPPVNKSFTAVKIIGGLMVLVFLFWLVNNGLTVDGERSLRLTEQTEENSNSNSNSNLIEEGRISEQNIEFSESENESESENARGSITQANNNKTVKQLNNQTLTDTIIKNALSNYKNHYQREKTFIQFDKTIYKPTEAVWFNVFVRNGNDFRAATSEIVYVELIAPNGKTLKTLTLLAKDGMAAGDFQLTDDYVGGLYKVKAYTRWQQNTNSFFEQTLQVQKTVLPKLNMKLEFARKAYGAGDGVTADLRLETVDNQVLADEKFDFTVSLAGQQIINKKEKTNKKGKAVVKFDLPKNLNTNDGLLNILINHNGSTESIARSIPIVLNKIDVQFLPEGGDLAADLKSIIAFKAINEFGQAADIEGEIYNAKGQKVSTFKSYHQGMGSFELLAKANEKYTAKITKPTGIKEIYNLPIAKAKAVLNIEKQTTKSIEIRIASTEKATYLLTATSRTSLFFSQNIDSLKGEKTITINTEDFPIGITELTLFNTRNQVIAERLVFVNPHRQLNIEIETDKENYKLRETVKAKIKVTDENGKAVKGQFSVSVVDETLLTLADDKQPNLLAHFLLTSDLKGEVKEPNFYFEQADNSDRVDRKKALDYVMLTHGWRRFAWEKAVAGNYPRFNYPQETTKFQGRVLDAFRRPLPNAKVQIKGTKKEVITDVHGNYIFESTKILPPFTIIASAEGKTKEMLISDFRRSGNIQVMANYKRDVYGQVLDYRFRGLKGVKVQAIGKDAKPLTTYTDKDGEFKFEMVDFNKYYKFVANYKGLQTYQNNGQAARGATVSMRFDINKVSELEGKVVSRQKKPIVGAKVFVQGMKDTVLTNIRGRYKIENVDFSKYQYYNVNYQGFEVTGRLRSRKEPLIVLNTSDIKAEYSSNSSRKSRLFGRITDENGDALIGANVVLYKDDKIVTGSVANIEGDYSIEDLGNGIYDIEVKYIGMSSVSFKGLELRGDNVKLDFPLYDNNATLEEIVVVGYGTQQKTKSNLTINQIKPIDVIYQVPIIEQDYTSSGTVVNSVEIQKLPNRDVSKIIGTVAGVNTQSEALTIRGSRSNGMDYYIDGIRVSGDLIPQSQIEQMPIITGGLPASMGLGELDFEESEVNFFTDDKAKNNGKINRVHLEKHTNEATTPIGDYTKRAIIDYGYSVNFQNGYYKAREFYTPKYKSAKTKIRDDFRTTLYWQNAIETNRRGEAAFEFPNADATTNYRITVAGFSDAGDIGLNTEKYFVQMPFALQTKVPNSILTGDKLVIPITLMNNTTETIKGDLSVVVPKHFLLQSRLPGQIKIKPNSTKVIKLTYLIDNKIAFGNINIGFKTDDFEDAFATNIQTLSRGFPITEVYGDNQISRDFDFELSQPMDSTLDIELTVYPNVVSDLVTGIDRMMRQPNGCFEQVSSSNYPNLLALNFLRNTNNRDQKIEAKAERFLQLGYDKMKAYEVEGGGFDWWGKAPAHEGLTAYGLMQFVDMDEVFDVEEALMERTAKWLLSRRDGKGGWKVNKKHLHSWGGNQLIRNAYIIWALTEAGLEDEIEFEIEETYKKAIQSEDAYTMALMANVMSIINDERAEELIIELLKMQKEDGSWDGKDFSITHSKGKNLTIETTALVTLAIMDWEADANLQLRQAIDFISKSKSGTGFGSTQSTVLAMKALVEFADYNRKAQTDGRIILYKGDREIAIFDYKKGMNQPIIFENLEQHFSEAKNKLKVRFEGTTRALSYDLSINYNTRLPQNNPNAPFLINTTIKNNKAKIGETIRLKIELKKNRNGQANNPIAIVGIPSGLSLQPWQLRELEEKNVADYIELWNGYIVFYFREAESKTINLDLKAETAGTFEAPASSAYLYYENEKKSWSLPEQIIVQ